MKRSEELKQQAQTEDNDFKALGLFNEQLRESRLENWEDFWKDKILSSTHVTRYEEVIASGKFIIETDEHGTLDFFPKANKLQIRRGNKWVKPGLSWLIKELL